MVRQGRGIVGGSSLARGCPASPLLSPTDVLKASDETTAVAEAALDPTFPTFTNRFVAEGGNLDYAGQVTGAIMDSASIEFPNWCQKVLHLPDPSESSKERTFEMNDAAKVLRWCHFEEYRAWLVHATQTMTRCFIEDFPRMQAVSGLFLGVW